MAETRVQIAYHFRVDPAQLVPGLVRLPEQIIRTVSVGEEFSTEKVGLDCLSLEDRARLTTEVDKQCREATRTARPASAGGSPAADPAAAAGGSDEEISAF